MERDIESKKKSDGRKSCVGEMATTSTAKRGEGGGGGGGGGGGEMVVVVVVVMLAVVMIIVEVGYKIWNGTGSALTRSILY